MAVIVHNLAADAYGLQACQLAQINSGFGVTGAHQYTALACAQRENVSRTAEVARLRTRLSAFFHGICALVSGNTGGGVNMINRNREGCFVIVGVVCYHSAKLQLFHNLAVCRHADKSACFLSHKVNSLGSAQLGCHNQVAFVFTVLVVGYQYHLTCFNRSDSFINCIILKLFHFLPLCCCSDKPIFQQHIFI